MPLDGHAAFAAVVPLTDVYASASFSRHQQPAATVHTVAILPRTEAAMSTSDNWDASSMPPQHGRIAVVTGANQGLGFVAARELATHGARVVLACRNEARAKAAVHAIRQHLLSVESPGEVEYMLVDVGSLESVRAFSAAAHARLERVDLLINNAGVSVPDHQVSSDGLSVQFGVNVLGAFHVTTLLFDLLKKSREARVVCVSSPLHRQPLTTMICRSTRLDFDRLPTGEGLARITRYEQSKLCDLVFTYELNRRLQKAGIRHVKAVATHPGVSYTNIFDPGQVWWVPAFTHAPLTKLFETVMQSAEMGALPILYGATHDDVKSGEFFGPDGFQAISGYPTREISSEDSYSEEYGRDLWALCERMSSTPFVVE